MTPPLFDVTLIYAVAHINAMPMSWRRQYILRALSLLFFALTRIVMMLQRFVATLRYDCLCCHAITVTIR